MFQGKCGLTALLPPPIHTAGKETNRTLLPYVFSKKKTTENKPEQNKKIQKHVQQTKQILVGPKSMVHPTQIEGIGSYGSDSEDENSTDFFSLESNVKPAGPDSSSFFSLDSSSAKDVTDKVTYGQTLLHANFPNVQPSVNLPATKVTLNLPPPIKAGASDKQTDLCQSENNKLISNSVVDVPGQSEEDMDTTTNQDLPLTFNSSVANAPLSFKSSMPKPYKNAGHYSTYQDANYGSITEPGAVGPSIYDQTEQVYNVKYYCDSTIIHAVPIFCDFYG